MRQINTTFALDPARQPFLAGSLQFIQDAYKEAIKNLAEGLIKYDNEFIILYGCQVTGSDPGVRMISSGAVYYLGTIYDVNGASVTTTGSNILVWKKTLEYASIDPVVFSDLSTHSVHELYKMALVEGPIGGSGVADYVCDYNSSIVRRAGGEWKNIGGFQNSFTAGTSTPQYRIDETGKVFLRGTINCPASGTANAFTLPAGARPANVTAHALVQNSGSPSFSTRYATIDASTGTLTFQDAGPGGIAIIYLDGLNFSL
jgi:hypothetical protein